MARDTRIELEEGNMDVDAATVTRVGGMNEPLVID